MVLPGPGAVSPYKRPKPPERPPLPAVAESPDDLNKRWHILCWRSGARTAMRSSLEARLIADAARIEVMHSDTLP